MKLLKASIPALTHGAYLITALCAFGQAPVAKKLAFEVASVKLIPASEVRQARTRGISPFLKVTGDRAHAGPAILSGLIRDAFKLESYQLEGPDWLVNGGDLSVFEIDATLPAGAAPDQAPLMLQTLLEERFGLKVHKGSKLMDGYSLVVDKGGPKLPPAPAVARDSKGMTSLGGGLRMRSGTPVHIEAASIADLMRYLAMQANPLPVLDKSGLQGSFDIQLDLPTPEKDESNIDRLAGPLKALGLKLERQKGPVETIVVDHVEKMPTAN